MSGPSPRASAAAYPNKGFLLRAQSVFVVFGGLYVLAVVLLTIPFIQTHTLYLNAVKLPWFAQFDLPEKYGLAPNKTLNFKLHTSDNITLGAWFILSDTFYHSISAAELSNPNPLESHFIPAVKRHPTILFFHGNAGTRAFHVRVQHYKAFSSRLQANVLAIDYRGFADSTGKPSEIGLARDARAAWDWLMERAGAKEEDVLIVGHSLGTGVAAKLAVDLAQKGSRPRGVVFMSPFSSITTLLDTYSIFGAFPLMKPLALIPGAPQFVARSLIHKFDTLSVIPGMLLQEIKASVLLAHAENDWDIPYTHSETLFDAFLEPYLPPFPSLPTNPASISAADWADFAAKSSIRKDKRKELLSTTNIRNFGIVDELVAGGRKVVLLKTLEGAHDYIGVQEGVQDIIGQIFGFV